LNLLLLGSGFFVENVFFLNYNSILDCGYCCFYWFDGLWI